MVRARGEVESIDEVERIEEAVDARGGELRGLLERASVEKSSLCSGWGKAVVVWFWWTCDLDCDEDPDALKKLSSTRLSA